MVERVIVRPIKDDKSLKAQEFQNYQCALRFAKVVLTEERCKVILLRFKDNKCWCKVTLYPQKKVGGKNVL